MRQFTWTMMGMFAISCGWACGDTAVFGDKPTSVGPGSGGSGSTSTDVGVGASSSTGSNGGDGAGGGIGGCGGAGGCGEGAGGEAPNTGGGGQAPGDCGSPLAPFDPVFIVNDGKDSGFETGQKRHHDIALYDANGDGSLDAIIPIDDADGGLVTLSNINQGEFVFPSPSDGDPKMTRVAMGDFVADADGKLELAASSAKAVSLYRLMPNNVWDKLGAMDLAAFGGNDVIDIGTSTYPSTNGEQTALFALLQQGSSASIGIATPPYSSLAAYPFIDSGKARALAVADLDGDSYPDLIASVGQPRSRVCARRWTGAALDNNDQCVDVDSKPTGIAAGDVDGDGDLDIVVTSDGEQSLSVLKNHNGLLSDPSAYPITPEGIKHPVAVALGDLDGDGDLDAVAANQDSQTPKHHSLNILLNDGTGAYTWFQSFDVDKFPTAVKIADLNGDCRNDIISSHGREIGRLTVILSDATGPGN